MSRNRGSRKPAAYNSILNPGGTLGCASGGRIHNVRSINCESIRTRRRQILHRDFPRDARRIACPIAHCGFAGEDRVFFCGRGDYDRDEESSRDPGVEENTSDSAIPHCFLESPLVCDLRGLLKAASRVRSGEQKLPACMSAAAESGNRRIAPNNFAKATGKNVQRVAGARTRSPADARRPRALPRTRSAGLVFFRTGTIENA